MNFDERTNAIGTLLRETILPRYKRPDHFSDATARSELADMVADLNSEWPIMPRERFEATGQALARELRRSYLGRSWPTIAHMSKALKAALSPAAPADGSTPARATGADRSKWRHDALLKWCKGNGTCPEFLITRENLGELVREGEIRRDQVETMLAYAQANLGVAVDEAPPPDHSGGGYRHFTAGINR